MKSLLTLFLLLVALMVPSTAGANHDTGYEPYELTAHGALSHGDYVACWLCDVVGVRNIQGGKHTGNPIDLNLDLGAGSTKHPGNIALNYDVGKCTHIYNGRKKRLASFCPRKIVFYVPVEFKRGYR